MKDKLSEALNEISDKHIEEAAKARRKRSMPTWFKIAAAAVAVALLAGLVGPSMSLQAAAVAQAQYPDYQYTNMDRDDALLMRDFFHASISTTLGVLNGENGTYSPLNLAMALSVLAELTDGEARTEILTVMNASSIDDLRSRANLMWRASYYDNNNKTTLANSLWLDNSVDFNQATLDTLAKNYYTSSFRGDLGSNRVNQLITQWLDQQTGNLLKSDTAKVHLPEEAVLALYSTIFYRAKWQSAFNPANNTQAVFHSPGGDITATFMNKSRMTGFYYWAEDFGAISIGLKDGSQMWLFLPDEDKTVNDVLASQDYMDVIYRTTENVKDMFINLSIPKFDIRQGSDLRSDLEKMGISAVFDPSADAFASSVFGTEVYLTGANQATRVMIDEEGITAASYIEFPGAMSPAPPEDEIDFILDRPFLFVITKQALPLFAGVVNEP